MATSEILPFALGSNSNVLTQAAYAALSARTGGFQSGVAPSNAVNKALRQAAFMSAVLGQWATNRVNGTLLDNGDLAAAEALLTAAVVEIIANRLAANNFATVPQLTAETNGRAAADAAEVQARFAADVAIENASVARYNDSVARSAAVAVNAENLSVARHNDSVQRVLGNTRRCH